MTRHYGSGSIPLKYEGDAPRLVAMGKEYWELPGVFLFAGVGPVLEFSYVLECMAEFNGFRAFVQRYYAPERVHSALTEKRQSRRRNNHSRNSLGKVSGPY